MKKLFIFLFSIYLTALATEALYGQSEIIFSYTSPQNHNARIYQHNQLLETIIPKSTTTPRAIPIGSHTFKIEIINTRNQVIADTKSLTVNVVRDTKVYVNIEARITPSGVEIREPIATKTEPLTPRPTIESVNISPQTIIINKGGNHQFTARVIGTNNPSQTVSWTVTGNKSSQTRINPSTGVLTIAANESSQTLTVKAASTVAANISGTAIVTVRAIKNEAIEPPQASTGTGLRLPAITDNSFASSQATSKQSRANIHLERATAHHDNNEYDQAIIEYNKAIQIAEDLSDPNFNFVRAYFYRGLVYFSRNNSGDVDRAIADYTEAIRLDPNFARLHYYLGLAHMERYMERENAWDIDRAIADYTEAIRIDPNFAWAHYDRGFSYMVRNNTGDIDRAIEDFETALRINPNNNLIRENLEKAKQAQNQANTPFTSIGFSAGTSFSTPAFIGTIHATFGLSNNFFIGGGLDYGLGYVGEKDMTTYTVDDYSSMHPYVYLGYFLPFAKNWYIGSGVGYMMSQYTFSDETVDISTFTLNLTTGFIIGDIFILSYTLRTNFDEFNNKFSAGIIYRFH